MIRQTTSVAVRLATTAAGRRLASTYLVFLAGITRVAGVTRITGEFERSLFSGRCEAQSASGSKATPKQSGR